MNKMWCGRFILICDSYRYHMGNAFALIVPAGISIKKEAYLRLFFY